MSRRDAVAIGLREFHELKQIDRPIREGPRVAVTEISDGNMPSLPSQSWGSAGASPYHSKRMYSRQWRAKSAARTSSLILGFLSVDESSTA